MQASYGRGHRNCFAKLEVSLIGSGGVYEPVGGGEVCSRGVVRTRLSIHFLSA